MAARKQTAVNTVASLEQQLAQLKTQLAKARAAQAADAGKAVAGSVTMDQVREIAKTKKDDLNAYDEDAAMKIIMGSARSMGLEVK